MWCIPELTVEFVKRMEDVLELYERSYDAKEPVVCLDEKPVQCLEDLRHPIRVKNGSVRRDYEYFRNGTANVFCVVEPRAGRHLTKATKNRKRPAFTSVVQQIAAAYPDAKTIHLVVDNLNTHTLAALQHVLGDEEGKDLWSRFTVHYTPKHGSWLNQAEIAISIFSRQCLGKRRIASLPQLKRETAAWCRRTDRNRLRIDWKFTVKKAREKFRYRKRKGKIILSGN